MDKCFKFAIFYGESRTASFIGPSSDFFCFLLINYFCLSVLKVEYLCLLWRNIKLKGWKLWNLILKDVLIQKCICRYLDCRYFLYFCISFFPIPTLGHLCMHHCYFKNCLLCISVQYGNTGCGVFKWGIQN